ncbi:MAG TPA: beta galactosidase jelly roll domain-containing protein, partial [Bacteroidota bacterium]|nr:beta galactosidase jelly roll domain-containing protein [Bacteroidota bacterium]
MRISTMRMFGLFMILGLAQGAFAQSGKGLADGDITLSAWQLRSTVLEKSTGEEISTGHPTPGQWYPIQVPGTVLDGLVKNGVYPNPRLDMNNYLIPDASDEFNVKYDLAKYSYLPNHENPWKAPYWFKTEFRIPEGDAGRQVWLNFDGINYRGEVWINGKRIADSHEMVGMFQRFKFNVTSAVRDTGSNFLAVKIYPVDHPGTPGVQMQVFGNNRGNAGDLFKDETLKISGGWDCALPVRDRNMGIIQRVYLSFTRDVDIVDPYIVTALPLPDTTEANLTISATLVNVSNEKSSGILRGKIDLLTDVQMGSYVKHLQGTMKSIMVEKSVEVPAHGEITLVLSNRDFPQLAVRHPHLWWPNGYGEQYLHNLQLSYLRDGKVSAEKRVLFGIRDARSSLKEIQGEFG